MFTNWRELLLTRLVPTILIIILAGMVMRYSTSQTPPASTTTTTTKSTTYIGNYIVSAYSSVDSCHHPQGELCLMADGLPASLGSCACPRKFPLGTHFLIGNMEYICRDRLFINYDYRFDIWFGYGEENHLRAKEWGLKELEVYIID